MSRDSGLTVGEETTDLHADRRFYVRQALSNSRPLRLEPGRHRAQETPVPPRPSVPAWADTTIIPAVLPASRSSLWTRAVEGVRQGLQTIRQAASPRGEL